MGSMRKRGKSYEFQVSLGYDMNGKKLEKRHTWKIPAGMTEKKAEKEAAHQLALFEEQCRTGQYIDSNIRFADFAETWLHNYAEKQLKATTVARYKELLIRINAAFGNMKLNSIQPHHLMAFYDNLEESGIRQDIKYKPLPAFEEIFREEKWAKERLGARAGVAASTIASALDGNNIRLKSAEKICTALGKDLSELFEPGEDKGLADTTILHYHRLISTILNTAVQ